MKLRRPDWFALIPTQKDAGRVTKAELAARIVSVLRSQKPLSRDFRVMLAAMIAPLDGKNMSPFELRLVRSQGKPSGTDWPVALEMERLVDVENVSTDDAVYRVQKKFGTKGNSRSKCMEALGAARRMTSAHRAFDEHVEPFLLSPRVQKTL